MLWKLRAEINSFITKQEAICRKNLVKQWGQCHYEVTFEFLSTLDFYDFSYTGKSLSEALIFASINPQYDNRLFMELP